MCWSCRGGEILPFRRTFSLSSRASLGYERLFTPVTFHCRKKSQTERLQRYATQSSAPVLRWPSADKKAKPVPKVDLSDPAAVLGRVIAQSKQIRSSPNIPERLDILELLETSRQLAEVLIYGETSEEDARPKESPTSSILGLEESSRETTKMPLRMSITFRERASASLAENLRDLLCDPKIYITPLMLQGYVAIQVLLGKPEYLPEIFHLYAHKPIPSPSSSSAATSITYTAPSPRNPKNAIPHPIATAALRAAITQKSLPLVLSIIDTTVATPAFRLQKLLSRATLPLTFLSLTPFCAYTISTYIAHDWQNTYDPTLATWLCMAGIMTYVGATATIGFVALTTSNDQMERVVWQPGTRLRDRWLREEERMAFDTVALAWGFKEKWRRGEERGEDWEALREFCARREMVLDKTDLLEGME